MQFVWNIAGYCAMSDTASLFDFDLNTANCERQYIAGVDEAGRGPLAGPVVAGAVILRDEIEGINDSKKLSEKKRETLYAAILDRALAWGVGLAGPQEIDKINILQASFLAMKRALEQLNQQWKEVLVDGNMRIPHFEPSLQHPVIGGDAKSASIAAASIIAKVTRDRLMVEYHEKYPQYEFHRHKGYPTKRHRQIVEEIGICAIHRKSYCQNLIAQTRLAL